MRFRFEGIEGELTWSENRHLNELVVENPEFLRKILKSFAFSDNENGLSLTENGKAMDLAKQVEVIFNPLKLDFNNRRAMATLLKMLVKCSISEDFYTSTNQFKGKVLKFLDELVDSENFEFEVEADADFGMDALAKAVSLHVVDDEDDYVELLTDYMTMMAELAGTKLFVFVGLRGLIGGLEWGRLLHNVKNHQLDLFLIESTRRELLEGCGRIVIDEDLCEA